MRKAIIERTFYQMPGFLRHSFLLLFLFFGSQVYAQLPAANFIASPTSGCAPLLVQFTNTSTGNPTSYSWNLGNSANSTLQNPSTTYTTPGTYSVSLTVANANGSNTKTITNYITVLPGPTVNFSGTPIAGCPPLTALFTNTTTSNVPGAITYQWAFGDGSPFSALVNPSHTYLNPGFYNVTLKATDASGCANTLTKPNYIQVYTPPIFNFTALGNQCDVPAVINFNSNVTGASPYSYQWTFGDGGTANTSSPTHTYNTPGIYSVSLIVTDANGCKDTLVKQNFMNIGNLIPNFTFNNACVNTSVQFTNTTNVSDSVKWHFGDGARDTSQNPSHIYTVPGTYNVKLVVYKASCKDSISKQLTVHPPPNLSFNFNQQPCPPPVAVTFNNTSTNALNYAWDFHDGGTSSQTNPTHLFTTDSFFAIRLVGVSAQGCRDTIRDTLKVYKIFPLLNPTPQKGCIPFNTQFFPVFNSRHPVLKYKPFPPPTLYPYPVTSFYWDLGNGTTSTAPNPTATYTIPGVHNVTLTFTTANGCTITDSTKVSCGYLPTAALSISNDSLCPNSPDTFVALSTGPSPLTHEWSFGDANGFGSPVIHHYDRGGIYSVTLIASHYGCDDTLVYEDTVVVLPPTSFISHGHHCDDLLKVSFYDTLSERTTSHLWIFGDGTTDTSTNPVHTYTSPGVKNVFLISYNDSFGCIDTAGIPVRLYQPNYSIAASDTAICRGDSIHVTPTVTGFNGLYPQVYWWWLDTSYAQHDTALGGQNFRFNQNGIYKVQSKTWLYYSCDPSAGPLYYYPGCWLADSQEVLVAKPYGGFTASPTLGCNPLSVAFIDTSTNTTGAFQTSRVWDFGNGTSTTPNANISRTYNAAGLYTVQLIVSDNVGCSDTVIQTNYIDVRQPVGAFTVNDTDACAGQLISFTNQTTGSSMFTSRWYFGDGTTDTARNPIHAYTQTGLYTATLVVTDTIGCKDSLVKSAYIQVSKPAANFTLSDTLAICPPLNVVFTNISSGALMSDWDLGNGTTSTLQNPTASYINPGIYTIRLIATSIQGCRDTSYAQVRVLGYSGALSYAPLNGCAPLEVGFKAQLYNIPSIIWDFSDGVTQPANGIDTTTHIYTSPGAYIPKLVLSDNTGCQNSSVGLDTIKVDGILPGFVTSPACINTPVTFFDTSFSYFSQVKSWRWSFNSGNFTTPNPTLTFNTAGSYPVKLVTTNANGCTDSVSTTFVIYDLPKIVAVSDTSICNGDAAQLSATGGISYVWRPALTLSCDSCQSPLATPTAPTNYVVMGRDVYGCTNKDTVRVTIQFVTTSSVANGGEICEDSSFQLLASGAHRYEWTPTASLSSSTVPNPLASPVTTTTYTVIAWEGSCPPDTNTVRVVVHPKPSVDAGTDVTIVAGKSVMLNAKGTNIEFYLWSPASTLSCENCSNPEANPQATTRYKVEVTSLKGCKAYDTVLVRVLCDGSQLFIPNTFSPNNDGQNDVFYPRGVGLKSISSFRIYNRWGELIFEKRGIQLNDRVNGWDGTYKGSLQSPDVFVYAIDGECESGEPISWKGDVTMLR